ncbi:MAG: hypothetical protein JRF27_02355 [Deltaproteobacteria bacterium]|nr:hypothetical protein [Deltaproteobacteria bacterium]
MIIKGSRELKGRYHELFAGDVFIGTIVSRHLKRSMLIDLLERGVICLPSPLSQDLNSSKVSQALVFKSLMLPHTCAVTRRTDLIDAVNLYNEQGIGPVVSKENHLHCGHGVRWWDTIETLYSFMALSDASYPFVVQPFLENFTDVRVIVVGDYVEAYQRYNPNNFRMNISSGGKIYPFSLDEDKERFCRKAMARGRFPFAHIDLHITDDGNCYLSEIALNGGIKGAKISRTENDQKKEDRLEHLAKHVQQG